jgi:GNAT superfamily N-acetyltransferase
VIVERVGARDWRRARDVRLRALADTPDAFGSTLDGELQFDDARWIERVSRGDAATFLARADDGADVGIAVGAANAENEAGLYSMWVAPEARGKGAGDALIEAVVAWARARGFARVVLDVSDFNEPAIAFYARHGFAPTGVTGTLPPPRTHVTEHQRALVL